MLDFPFHHEFIEFLGRWTHILITLPKRHHGQVDTAIPRYLLVTIREKTGIVKLTTVQNTAFTTQSNQLKKIVTALKNVKKILVSAHNSQQAISDMKLDSGIVSVLTSLNKLKCDEYDISYDSKQLTDKISPENNRTLYKLVKNPVIDNYLTIQKIIVNLDKQGKIDYEEIQYQTRSMYKKLKAAKHNNLAIFNTISEKLHKATLQDIYFCQMIVSYFIQKCEVLE